LSKKEKCHLLNQEELTTFDPFAETIPRLGLSHRGQPPVERAEIGTTA